MSEAPPPVPVLDIRGLCIDFAQPWGRQRVLDGLDLRLARGRTLALVGESGSGKSITAQAILGILPANARISAGHIDYHRGEASVDLAALAPQSAAMRALRGDQISIIFQEPMVSLSPLHTLQSQIGEVLALHTDTPRRAIPERVCEMLERVGFPHPRRALKQYTFELSGGLRQRAMIAQALICRPALLIADEPTTALDVTVQAQILGLIRSLQAEMGMAVLLITHDLGVVAQAADDVAVLHRGDLVERGPAAKLIAAPRHPYLKALFAALPAQHRFGTPPHLATASPPAARSRGDSRRPHLCIRGLRKRYTLRAGGLLRARRQLLAVNDIDLDIGRGERVGLVGESGCGKTSLSKLLMRGVEADAGSVRYCDAHGEHELLELRGEALRRFRPKMQLVFQDPHSSLNPRMTVRDILCEPLQIHAICERAEAERRAAEALRLVGLPDYALGRYPHSFSGGQRQRICIARALIMAPQLLILDEPVSALDTLVQAQVLDLLDHLQRQLGLSWLFISHNLDVVRLMAERIAVMCRGQIVELAPAETLFAAPEHPYTRALLAAIPAASLDPAARLDTGRLRTTPEDWPPPWRLAGEQRGHWTRVGERHFVRRGAP